MITSKTPKLDLHGEIVAMVEVLVNEFIIIIHGKSTNILTEEVSRVLSRNKDVLKYRRNNWNLGETIVKLKI